MKKLIAAMFLGCMLLVSGIVYGDSSNVKIEFKVGDEILKINDKDVKVEKPLLVNGVTLVPLRVISEAFGSEVKWNDGDRSILIDYSGVKIKLVVDSKKVLLADKEGELLEAPVIKNGVTMVPLRFITENFGADVKYDDKTSVVSVVKEIAGDKSIKDFSLILKKTNKSKVGDSFYNWSINLPKDAKLKDREFGGTKTIFTSDDASYIFGVSVYDGKNQTLDTMMSKQKESSSDYTLISLTKEQKNGEEFLKIVGKKDYLFDNRIYLKDGKVYSVIMTLKDAEKYTSNPMYATIADSFTLSFDKSGSTEDLSDINDDGLRTYEDKNLKWSIEVPPEFEKVSSKEKANTVEFMNMNNMDDDHFDSIYVDMFSIKDDLTLDQWFEKDVKILEDKYNSEILKIVKKEDGVFNGMKCKKLITTVKIGDSTVYGYDLYLFGKDYMYNAYYAINEKTYNDKEKLKIIEDSISSFKFTDPDSSKVGLLSDPTMIDISDSIVTKKNSDLKWSFEVPSTWTAGSGNNDKDKVYYINDNMMFKFVVLSDVNEDAFVKYLDDEFSKGNSIGTYKDFKKEEKSYKGMNIYEYNYKQIVSGDKMIVTTDVFGKNGKLYIVDRICGEISYSEKNKTVLDNIWKSLKVE